MAVDVSPKKQYAIEMTDRGEYLHAVVGAKRITPEIAMDYWHEIITECERLGRSKILLEHDVVEMATLPDLLEFIGPLAELLQGRMLAFYHRYGHYEIPALGKQILRSKDVQAQIFDDLKQAERWLLAN